MTPFGVFLSLWFLCILAMIGAAIVVSCPLFRRQRLKRKRERQRQRRDYRQSVEDGDVFF
jgi:hypothetical protein